MVIVLMAASILGGAIAAVLFGFGQHSFLVALLSAPLGGSLFVSIAALLAAAHPELVRMHGRARAGLVRPPAGVVWC